MNIVISNVRCNPNGSAYIKTGNVGDICGYYILKHFTDQPIFPININSPKQSDGLVMVGSTLNLFFKLLPQGTVIGTGSIRDTLRVPKGAYNFLGVRGHLTASLLEGDIPVISDLGLLLPLVFPMNVTNRGTKDVGYIIHSVDRKAFFSLYPNLKDNLVNNYSSPEEFVQQLSQYKRIISSSLHGLIFAHAYGIPCAGIKVTDKITGGEFKYQDYYSSLDFDYPGRLDINNLHSHPDKIDWIDLVNKSYNPSPSLIQKIQTNQIKVLTNYLSQPCSGYFK